MFVVWSIDKAAWVTPSFTYSSQLSQAKRFDADEAIEQCVKHARGGAMMWMPVRRIDLETLLTRIAK